MPDDTDINLEAQVKDHDDTKQTIALKVSQDRALIPFMVQNFVYDTLYNTINANTSYNLYLRSNPTLQAS